MLYYFRSAPARVPFAVPEAEADPHGVLPLAAAQAGAGLREQPVRGGPGEEGARQDPALVRDPGADDDDMVSICILFVCA